MEESEEHNAPVYGDPEKSVYGEDPEIEQTYRQFSEEYCQGVDQR